MKEDSSSSDYHTAYENQSTVHSSEFQLEFTDMESHQGSEKGKNANSKMSSPGSNNSSRRASCCNTTAYASEVSPTDQTVDTSNQSILDISAADISMASSTKGGIQE